MRPTDHSASRLMVLGVLMLSSGPRPQLFAQAAPTFVADGEPRGQFGIIGGISFWPRWSGKGLVGCETSTSTEPTIFVIGADGTREDVQVMPETTGMTLLLGAAGGSDGSLAVIGKIHDSDARGDEFVTWISPDRKRQVVIRVSPYAARAVTITSDGAIWTAGWVEVNGDYPPEDFDLMKRFDRDGKLVASFLPVTKARGHPDAAADSFLVSSPDRVGWYAPRYNFGYVEFAVDGRKLGRYPGVPWTRLQRITGVALGPDNRLILSREDRGAQTVEFFMLDRDTRAWTPFHLPDESQFKPTEVSGFSGDKLVTRVNLPSGSMFHYYRLVFPANRTD